MTNLLQAGRELDALIAEKVLRYHRGVLTTYGGSVPCWQDAAGHCYPPNTTSGGWSPSTKLEHAWSIVEYMWAKPPGWALRLERITYDCVPEVKNQWCVFFHTRERMDPVYLPGVAYAETPSLAICLAALEVALKDKKGE